MAEAGNPINYTELAATLIQNNIDSIFTTIKSMGAKVASELKYQLTDVFASYYKDAVPRYSSTKTILYRNIPVPLYDFYVPLDIRSPQTEKVVRSPGAAAIAQLSRLLIVSGTAGTGKSTFLKHIFLDSIKTGTSLPIYVELRRLNSTKLDLRELIAQLVQLEQVKIGSEYIDRAFGSGKFTLLLDAYDELNVSLRESVRDGVFSLAQKFPNLNIIVTSRPDSEFVAWPSFSEFHAMKLSKQQALSLVDRLNYEPEIKSSFLKELDRSLYKQHESFLSNPLLLTIMLLTYHDNAEIPKKKHLFFSMAFHALYSQHDAMKDGGGYKRQIQSTLAMDDFQRILSAFSIQTFLNGELTFSEEGVRDYLSKAKDVTGLVFDTAAYIDDLLRAVCMLSQDGLFLSFTHKQFQEYFVAHFIAHAVGNKQGQLIRKVAPNYHPNEVIRILHDMAPSVSEKHFVLPGIRALLKKVKFNGTLDDQLLVRFYQLVVRRVRCGANGGVGYYINDMRSFDFIRFVQQVYYGIVSRTRPSGRSDRSVSELLLSRARERGTDVICNSSELPLDKELMRAVKADHFLNLETVKYLVDVKDFIEMRLKSTTTSLNTLLGRSARSG